MYLVVHVFSFYQLTDSPANATIQYLGQEHRLVRQRDVNETKVRGACHCAQSSSCEHGESCRTCFRDNYVFLSEEFADSRPEVGLRDVTALFHGDFQLELRNDEFAGLGPMFPQTGGELWE